MSDITQRGSFPRDDNSVPITGNGLLTSKSITLTGSNATVAVPLFHITGTVEVFAIYGVITTAFGDNHTAAYFRVNDQTAQVNITLNTGTTLSSKGVGSTIAKLDLASVPVTLIDSAAGAIKENVSGTNISGLNPFATCILQKKSGAVTDIEYVYTTTNTPTTGAITFYCGWIPLSSDGRVTPV